MAIVHESLVGAFVDAKHVANGRTAMLMQGVLAAFIQEGHLARHLRKTRALSKYGATDRGGLVFGFAGASRAAARLGLQVVRQAIMT